MIPIQPTIQFQDRSPYEGGTLQPRRVIWQGVHTCVESVCSKTGESIIADLPVGHATLNACKVNLRTKEIFCAPEVTQWLGKPLLESLASPSDEEPAFTVEVFKEHRDVIILNCIDHLYGHAVLKLFNAERHLNSNPNKGVIVLVQEFLRWLVPEGVAEVWTVAIPLSKAQRFYPSVDRRIHQECQRFDAVSVSSAYSHPTVRDITRFTRVRRHNDHAESFRISYIWRDDRPWTSNPWIIAAAKATGTMRFLLQLQHSKVVALFSRLRKELPDVRFTVAGIGKESSFPEWIDDQRVQRIDPEKERALCTIYAESRLVIGVHGSNMLLPSAHAGMTIDLMPKERWGNFAQDIIFQENDPRIGSFRYRFFPISTRVSILAHLIATQIREFEYFKKQMSR